MTVYSIGSILTGDGSGPWCHSPKETGNAHSSSSKGKGRLPASSSTPLLFRRRELRLKFPPPPFYDGSIHQIPFQGRNLKRDKDLKITIEMGKKKVSARLFSLLASHDEWTPVIAMQPSRRDGGGGVYLPIY